ncbi:TorD/DmsD family molecular chaperone [Arabiibacter massiliensis]|uniref:TorD/DmsD family molecular chaperone n=1 Tax=Arabiibacter massiliensis TaxID=1870985 RepID=UPI0009BACFD3|nr:molecular chaperone TorD family protein [Arabiibacter massiliensis]
MSNASCAADAARELLEERELACAFLSMAYLQEVNAEFLERLRDEPPALEGEMGAFAASLAEADLEEVRKDLAAEYARIFLGMSASPVAPYESVYTSELHLLMQEARDDVRRVFRAEGFAVASDVRLPEDHVAFELEFMGRMCRKELDALASGDAEGALRCREVQRGFFAGHLANWLPAFCDDVRKRARTPFYRGVVELTESYLDAERAALAEDAA